jgi:hypothetical protein
MNRNQLALLAVVAAEGLYRPVGGGGGGGGFTQLTGDVLAGPGSGSQAATVVSARGGVVGWAATTGVQTWATGATAELAQASTTGATGANMVLAPQASTNGNGTPGSLVVALAAPTGSGAEASLQVTQSAAIIASIGYLTGGTSVGLWLAESTPSAANFSLANTGSALYFNAVSSMFLQISGASAISVDSAEVDIGTGFNFGINTTAGSYGGGVGVVGLAIAGTQPTTLPTGLVLAESSTGLFAYQHGNSFNRRSFCPVPQGTAASQAATVVDFFGFASTTTGATTTTIVTIPLPGSSNSIGMIVTAVGRQTSGTVGATTVITQTVGFKNISGTVTALTTQGTATVAADTGFTGGSLAYAISGTNVEIQVDQGGTAAGNADWTCYVTACVYN